MTKNEAIKLFDSRFWENMSYEERAKFQLFESKLCMPFGIFHEAMEKTLGRPVFTHEFGSKGTKGLKKELLGEKKSPTMEEIMNLIPKDKRIIVAY